MSRSLRHLQLIIQEIEFESNGIIREIVDLQGVHLHGITGEWRPYFNENDCGLYTGCPIRTRSNQKSHV